MVNGEGTEPWHGNLILIYEAKTDSLFHLFISPSESLTVTSDLILHFIINVTEIVINKVKETPLATQTKRLSASIGSSEVEITKAYDLALKQLNVGYTAASQQKKSHSRINWQDIDAQNKIDNFFSLREDSGFNKKRDYLKGWQIQQLENLPDEEINIDIQKAANAIDTKCDISTALKFDSALNLVSERMTKIADHNNHQFSWHRLTPPGSQDLKATTPELVAV